MSLGVHRGAPQGKLGALFGVATVQSDANDRTFVFISSSHEDRTWRDRIKVVLASLRSRIRWWDDSRILTGDEWQGEIADAINHTRVALVLLSPHYIASSTAINELRVLTAQAEEDGLRVFPIIVSDCDWQSLDTARFQLWNQGRPLDTLPDHLVGGELERIAAAIADILAE